MSQPTPPDRLRSVFSIIELDFKEPFTERGPPAFLEEIFRRCLTQLEQETNAKWIMWGDDLTDPDRVCIMIGRRLSSRQRGVAAQAAMSDLKAKGMPITIRPLLPFLASEPIISHFHSPERNEPVVCDISSWQERHCDIFTVEAPLNGPLHESIRSEMMTLREDAYWLTPTVVRGQRRPWGDVKLAVLGFDECDEMTEPIVEPCMCTFVFIVYWTHPEAMARFKNPERESIRKYGWKTADNWWKAEVVERFARLEHAGARVTRGTFKLWDFEVGSPLIWPEAEAFENAIIAGSIKRGSRGKRHKGCCIM